MLQQHLFSDQPSLGGKSSCDLAPASRCLPSPANLSTEGSSEHSRQFESLDLLFPTPIKPSLDSNFAVNHGSSLNGQNDLASDYPSYDLSALHSPGFSSFGSTFKQAATDVQRHWSQSTDTGFDDATIRIARNSMQSQYWLANTIDPFSVCFAIPNNDHSSAPSQLPERPDQFHSSQVQAYRHSGRTPSALLSRSKDLTSQQYMLTVAVDPPGHAAVEAIRQQVGSGVW